MYTHMWLYIITSLYNWAGRSVRIVWMIPVTMDTLCISSAVHCCVYRARNYFSPLIGSFSLTRCRTCHTIGPPIRLWRVVVIPNLWLARILRGLVAQHVDKCVSELWLDRKPGAGVQGVRCPVIVRYKYTAAWLDTHTTTAWSLLSTLELTSHTGEELYDT